MFNACAHTHIWKKKKNMENSLVLIEKEVFLAQVKAIILEAIAEAKVNPVTEELPEWVSRKQAAEYLGCTPQTVDNLARKGALQKKYLAGMPRFKREDLKTAFEQVERRLKNKKRA